MLQAEQVLNERYQLKQKIGQNAGRQTWLATDIGVLPEQLVIVKLLAFGGEVQWDDLKLFEREAQVLKQLNHPRIPKYRDYFSLDDRMLWFGLVQEYIPGLSLKEQLNQGKRFTELQARKIAVDILEILNYLHQLNPTVLHRDIKPSNLIWGEDRQVYLVDFGAVQDRAAKEGATFTVVGTYGYAPMEQFGGRAVPASDLYALGATLIHLLTGTAPADLPQKDLRIQFSDKVNLKVSFVSWIEQMTEPALERRFKTAQQALNALKSDLAISSQTRNSTPARKISLPTNSRIQVSKSTEQLKIQISERSIKLIEIPKLLAKVIFLLFICNLWISLFHASASVGIFIFVIVMWVTIHSLLSIFETVSIKLTHSTFRIKKQIFNWCFYNELIPLSLINYVFCKETNTSREVVIQVSNSLSKYKYSFGQGLTQDEQAWLTQEIGSWLNIN
ncbi:MAG: serine/threonine protein kinase [Aphanothece sp. CMT-3BRIN-NPC111]|jgi:serine/threonine protein kinase|nr:serine/threonine protein kinase [Aphanothece sp. CMT-3BRIN-NPC111]